jgi:hypothetical protein
MVDDPKIHCSICHDWLEIAFVPLDIQVNNIIIPHQMVQVAQCWTCGIQHAVVGLTIDGNRLKMVLEDNNGKDDRNKEH